MNKICINCHHARITQSIIGVAEKENAKPERLNFRYCIETSNFKGLNDTCKDFKQNEK